MRIGIDIDDTISDTYEVYFAYAEKYVIEDLHRDGKINNDAEIHHHYIKNMFNLTQKEEDDFWDKYYAKNLHKVKPLTLARETIEQLKKDGHEIVIITARWPEKNFDIREETIKWLSDNNIKFDDIVLNAANKAVAAREKKIDLFIDDSFKNCEDVSSAGITTFLMDTRTNKGLEKENITRVYSWPDIYYKIKRM